MFKPITGTLKKGRPRASGHPSPLTAVTRKGAKSPTGEKWYPDRVFFRIQQELWQPAGFTRGDKVQILFDADNGVGLIQQSDEGYTLTASTCGFDLTVTVPFDPASGFPSFDYQTGMVNPHIKESAIYFHVPTRKSMKSLASKRRSDVVSTPSTRAGT